MEGERNELSASMLLGLKLQVCDKLVIRKPAIIIFHFRVITTTTLSMSARNLQKRHFNKPQQAIILPKTQAFRDSKQKVFL